MAYRIEPATFAHLPWLRLLFERLAAEHPVPYPVFDDQELDQFTLSVARHLQNNPDFGCFVALIGKRVVGFVAGEVCERTVGRPHRFANAHWMYVVKKHRGKGVGVRLIAAGVEWMRAREITHLECLSFADDDAWARRGFTPLLTRYCIPLADLAMGRRAPREQSLPRQTNGHDPAPPGLRQET